MINLAIYEPNRAAEFQPILPLYQAEDSNHAGLTPHEGVSYVQRTYAASR